MHCRLPRDRPALLWVSYQIADCYNTDSIANNHFVDQEKSIETSATADSEENDPQISQSTPLQTVDEDPDARVQNRYTTALRYPPNSYGWNAANHPNPVLELIFFLREMKFQKDRIGDLESLLYR